MQLIGYIAQCHDHEYVIVTQFKPSEQDDKDWHGVKVYTTTDEVYSTAVKCHAKGVPAVLYFDKVPEVLYDIDGINKECLVATCIDPIDLTGDDVNGKLQSLTTSIESANRNVNVLTEHVEEIVNGFLSAFRHYRQFNENYQLGCSAIEIATCHAEMLKTILNKESEQ